MALTAEQLERFHEDGFVIVPDVFEPAELQPTMDAIAELVDLFADQLYANGKIRSKHADKDFHHRLAAIEQEHPETSVLLHQYNVLPLALARLWSCDKLIDMVGQIVGPDIAGHPIWNIRSKTPQTRRMTVPWHQDTAYLLAGAETTLQPAAWIPFEDIDANIGAMQVIRGGHKPGQVFKHYRERLIGHSKSWYLFIPDNALPRDRIVTCEMRFGSVLLLNQLVPHRSLENFSDKVRWSVDLRWQDPKLPNGVEGHSEPIVMRKADDPGWRPDWEAWIAAEEKRQQAWRGRKGIGDLSLDIEGGWLARWPDPVPEGARIE
ncbi:MAG: phytanoyl-CoA dioxygenase family protein [Alphaproteobacteria bacterium]